MQHKTHPTLKRFFQFAKSLWTSPFSDLFEGEMEQGYLMIAWWQCQYDQSNDMEVRHYCKEILLDEEKMFEFNELCNRNHLTLRQVEQLFDEVYQLEIEEDTTDMWDGLTTEELNGQR